MLPILHRRELERLALQYYRDSQDIESKWFEEDLKSFKLGIILKSGEELITTVSRLQCLTGKSAKFNAMIKREVLELERGGMYDLGNAKPENALS